MPSSRAVDLYKVLRLVRPLHQYSAKAVSDALEKHAVSMPMRAVLERLTDAGPLTVPQIARSLWLPRQVVQRLADEAAGLGLLTWSDNPAHRRSRLAALTPDGVATFTALHERELLDLEPIAKNLDPGDIAACLRVMSELTEGVRAVAARRQDNHGWSTPGPLPGEEIR